MSLLLWLLSLLALMVAQLLVPHPAVLCTLIVFAGAPVISWLIMVTVRKKVQISLSAPGVAGKNKPFVLQANLQSSGCLPVGKIVLWLCLTNDVTGETQKKRVAFRGSGQWILESAYCGCIECVAASIWCYDIFGVLPLRIRGKAKKRTVVMPDTFPVSVETVFSRSDQEDCTEYAPNKKGTDPTEILQIRDYVPGDSLRQIHWKLSGKLDKLMVRDPAQAVDRDLLVFLEKTDAACTPERADALLEAVTSLCQTLAEMGQPFRLAWNEDVIVTFDITNKEQLPEAISGMLKAHRTTSEIPGSVLYQKTRGDGNMGAVLYFCSALAGDPFPEARTQIFLCGEGSGENVTAFTPQTMYETLRILTWS